MKRFLLNAVLVGCTANIWAQNSIRAMDQLSSLSVNDKWDLNKYVWSHTNTALKGDKAVLDFDAIDNWENLNDRNLSISPDGKYFAYGTFRGSTFFKKHETMIIQSTGNSWQKSFEGVSPGFFSSDCRQYIFKQKDELCFLQLGSDQVRYVKTVYSYKQPVKGKGEWLAYQLNNNESIVVLEHLLTNTEKRFKGVLSYGFDNSGKWLFCQLNNTAKGLLVYNLVSGKELHFQSVEGYACDMHGKILVLKTIEKVNNLITTALEYVVLGEGEGGGKTIWSTADNITRIGNYSIDGSGKQVVFTLQTSDSALADNHKQRDNSILYWSIGMDKAVLKVNNLTVGMAGLSIQGPVSFTDNDRYIQFSLQAVQDDLRLPASDAVKIDVWSYQDSLLQCAQPYLMREESNRKYYAIINPQTDLVIRLEREYEKLYTLKGDFAIVKKSNRDLSDRFWKKDDQNDSNWVVSLNEGSRHLLPTKWWRNKIWFSPRGDYLIYFDVDKQCHYFSYDLRTGKIVKISAGIPDWQLGYENYYLHQGDKPTFALGIAGWLQADESVLIYDNFDIWQLDFTGKKPPVNITNGYGRKHNTLFSLMDSDRFLSIDQVLNNKDTLLLRAFNRQNKYNGFYRKVLGGASDPELLSMGPYFLQTLAEVNGLDNGMQPIRAINDNIWIVKRQTATEAPNYFLTNDFKTYKPLTGLQPHTKYNWLTTELHTFRQLDGTISKAVLYKPENFDPHIKYPVIISFYGDLSDRLYQYPTPSYLLCPSIYNDPAWMVSHGYLVFTPDIYFTKGQWGPSTVNTIDGAAKYLSQLPFVDQKRLGACGHSNSGRFGYYLFTHSKSFAAMSLGSGFGGTNMLSLALSTSKQQRGEASNLEWAESSAFGSGLGNLWQNKQAWLDHTAVLNADKSSSPLLLFHNKNDGDDVMLAVQLFISLRRLEKKVWWLQYDNGYHTVWGKDAKDAKDFTIRYTQFFDHYLKGAPAPEWMTKGIPAKLKGIESRYDLDLDGTCGKNCTICHKARVDKQ